MITCNNVHERGDKLEISTGLSRQLERHREQAYS